MKSKTFPILFLFFCCFSIIFSQTTYNLSPGRTVDEYVRGNDSIKIQLNGGKSSYQQFIKVELLSQSKLLPTITISKDDRECSKNRLYSGTQSSDSTYFFFKTEEIFDYTGTGQFYICLSDIMNGYEHRIHISDEVEASLPIDGQTSYLVNEYNTKMKFHILFNKDKIVDHITIWAKGQNITEARIERDPLAKQKFEYGYVFYGNYRGEELEIEIEGQAGDFINVGSISSSNGKTDELKENSKEITFVKTSDLEEICFPCVFEKEYPMHITGKVYTRKASAYFKYQSGYILNESQENITNGILTMLNAWNFIGDEYGDSGFFCLSGLEKKEELLIFSLQMTTNRNLSLIHPPKIFGEIRRHFLLEGEFAAFYGLKPKETANEVNLNLKSLRGFPAMYFEECSDFPNCQYNFDSIKNKERIFPSNRMTVYSFYIKEEGGEYKNYNPITRFQPLMLVYCREGARHPGFRNKSYCEFDTSFFTNEDHMDLYEGSSFSQYLLKDEIDNYRINLQNEIGLNRIFLDLMIFSGDVDVRLNGYHGRRFSNKYYLSSKIYYSIRIPYNVTNITEIAFDVIAQKNSFYMVQYQLIKRRDEAAFLNTIESGINYIASLTGGGPESERKIFNFINYRYEYYNPYLITFYSQNSNFLSYRILSNETGEACTVDENTGQMIIDNDDDDYTETFQFGLELTNIHRRRGRAKTYMIYVAGLELSSSLNNWNERAISLSEGVPHRYVFTQRFPHIFYAYHMSDYTKDLVLKFLLLDKGDFEVRINIDSYSIKNETVYRDGNIYVRANEFRGKCKELEVCTIVVAISMMGNNPRRMEFSMYQIDENPIYLEKNVVKKDIIDGDKVKHYYFDIEADEFGDITLDFKRGSGNIYASIVRREFERPIQDAEWRGRYKFPTTIEDTLKYATYNKKIIISKESTHNCTVGCFVLISVVSNLVTEGRFTENKVPYRISITPRVISNYTQDIEAANPKVKIDVNEFVIGDINPILSSVLFYDYYEVTLPSDSDYIYLDWQADSPSFLINIGTERPNINDKYSYHFSHSPDGDSVYQFPKDLVLEKINSQSNTLEGLTLTIGIYANTVDSIYSSPYAFKIYLPPKDQDIIHIRSDQKVQCFSYNKIRNDYVCYFAVIFDEMDIGSNLVIYLKSQGGEVPTVYGNMFDKGEIEKNNVDSIKNYFNSIYNKNNYKINQKYIYINGIPRDKSYLFMALLKQRDTIEVFSSTYYIYEDMILYPNPSSPQIFGIGNKKINLNFKTMQDLLLNIVSISGEGFFQWETKTSNVNKKYYLNGFEDRLSLSTYTNVEQDKLTSLIVDAKDSNIYGNDQSGFIFYITYYPRNYDFNIDQLKEYRTSEFNYRTATMPLNYYAKITKSESWFANIDLYDSGIRDNEIMSYDNQLFNIVGTVISEETAKKARFDPKFKPTYEENNSIKGQFDLAFGMISINSDFIRKLNADSPYIFFSLENTAKSNLNNMGLELSLFSSSTNQGLGNSLPENIYINGKLTTERNVYILKTDQENPYVNLEYSSNSDTDSINFTLSTNLYEEEKNNFEIQKSANNYGKTILLIHLKNEFFSSNQKLYLIINRKKQINEKLGNYVFKYMNANGESDFYTYPLPNSVITYSETKNGANTNYKVEFYPIENQDVTYYIKAVYNRRRIKEEVMKSIAITETLGKNMQINNPQNSGKLSYTFENIGETVSFIKVTAKINQKTQRIFLSYDPVQVSTAEPELDPQPSPSGSEPTDGEEEDDKTLVYVSIGIGSVLLVAIIVLIVVVLLYKNKHKDLLTQVNKISFVENPNESGKGDNLLCDDENSNA